MSIGLLLFSRSFTTLFLLAIKSQDMGWFDTKFSFLFYFCYSSPSSFWLKWNMSRSEFFFSIFFLFFRMVYVEVLISLDLGLTSLYSGSSLSLVSLTFEDVHLHFFVTDIFCYYFWFDPVNSCHLGFILCCVLSFHHLL